MFARDIGDPAKPNEFDPIYFYFYGLAFWSRSGKRGGAGALRLASAVLLAQQSRLA